MDSSDSDDLCRLERRAGSDRRQQVLRAFLIGSLRPRRRRSRRAECAGVAARDWHSPKWFAVALLILILSLVDSLLTLVLLDHGAIEINPLMRFFILEGGRSFALVKLGLTSLCITLLIAMTPTRAFGQAAPAGHILYGTLLAYISLVSYELWLLDALPRAFWS